MKSVVVEIKDGFAAILSDNGCITKVVNQNYEVGQVIEMNTNKKVLNVKKLVAGAATVAILIAGAGFGTWAYASPYSYVSLDVNPSIEYTINRFDRVLSVKAVNDDGSEILKDIQLDDLENQTIESALSKTLTEIAAQGYFEGDDVGGIVIATSSENIEKSEELAKELEESVKTEIETTLEEKGEDTVVEVESISVGYDRVQEAAKLGVTPGKLNLVEKLQASSDNPEGIVTEEWLNKPVKEIMKAIKENRKASKFDQEDAEATETLNTVTPTEAINEDTIAEDADSNEDANEADENATDKAKKAEDKQAEKAKKAEDKAAEKAKKADDKLAEKAKEANDKEAEKAKEAKEKEAEKAKEAKEKEAEKAKKAKEKDAEKAKETKEKDAEKAKEAKEKDAEKVKETKNNDVKANNAGPKK
jgi:hypothetical protein